MKFQLIIVLYILYRDDEDDYPGSFEAELAMMDQIEDVDCTSGQVFGDVRIEVLTDSID